MGDPLYSLFVTAAVVALLARRPLVFGSAAALAQGKLISLYGDNNGLTTKTAAASGQSTILVTPTVAFTANVHEGAIMYVTDVSAGAVAPENEYALIKSNTTAVLNLDPAYPLTAALATGDTIAVMSTYQVELAAASDVNTTCQGVVVPADGIDVGSFGFSQIYGKIRALMTTSTLAAQDQLICGTGLVEKIGTGGVVKGKFVIGKALAAAVGDTVGPWALVLLAVGSHAEGSFANVDVS